MVQVVLNFFDNLPLGFTGLEGGSITSDGVEGTASFLHGRFVDISSTSSPAAVQQSFIVGHCEAVKDQSLIITTHHRSDKDIQEVGLRRC